MPVRSIRALLALALLPLLAAAQTNEELIERLQSSAVVRWHAATVGTDPVIVRLIGFNDLHGTLAPQAFDLGGRTRPIGGAANLAAYIEVARAPHPERTLILIAGDSIGASELASGWLRDEPTLAILNELTDKACPALGPRYAATPAPLVTHCHVLAAPGNHEFDHGTAELERLLYGGKHRDGPVLGHDWTGVHFPFLAANVVRKDGAPFLPGSAIVELDKVRIGVIGAVTADTPGLVLAGRTADLEFRPEAPAINAEVARLRALGVHTIVLVIHEGLIEPTTPQWVAALAPDETHGRLAGILGGLEGGVDVVIAGHTHKFNNLMVRLKDGTLALVAQARSNGMALSVIDLTIDRQSGATIAKEGRVGTAWADAGLAPHKKAAKIVAAATSATQAIAARPIGVAAAAIRRAESPSGESALGDLVADAERAAAGTDFAFVNAGGIRTDLEAGPIRFGALYAVQPFGNTVVKFTMTGAEVLGLLEQQWSGAHVEIPLFLRSSGLRYVFDFRRAPGHRVIAAWDAEQKPLDPARRYSVASNNYLTGGGGFYPALAQTTGVTEVMSDLAALEAYVRRAPGPIQGGLDGRMERVDAAPP